MTNGSGIVIKITGGKIRKETKAMCSLKDPSMLRDTSTDTLQPFKWDILVAELQQKAPILTKVLRQCSQRPGNHQKSNRRPAGYLITMSLQSVQPLYQGTEISG